MSVPITERLLLHLRPGHGNIFYETMQKLAAIFENIPGTQSLYWGLYEEDGDTAEVLVFWDRIESHAAFASMPENLEPIHAVIGPHLTAASQMHEIFFNPSALANLLEVGVVQMVTIYGVSAVGSIVKALRDFSTCKGFEVGDVVQEIKLDDTDQVARAVVITVDWKGPVSEEDKLKRGVQWWSNEAVKLRPGAKVEMHNVKFKKSF